MLEPFALDPAENRNPFPRVWEISKPFITRHLGEKERKILGQFRGLSRFQEFYCLDKDDAPT